MRNYFDLPQPALIVAQSRSGSTYLAHCLDSHLQIGCERGEPFSPGTGWLSLGMSHPDLAMVLWRRVGYRVAMFKVSYRQIKNGYLRPELLYKVQPKIIHLHRANVLEALISSQLCTASLKDEIDHPVHTYEPVRQQALEIDCHALIDRIEDYLQRIETMRQILAGLDVLELTYEQITGGGYECGLPDEVSDRICAFLGVDRAIMWSELVKLNEAPLIKNGKQVEETLKNTPHEWMWQ